MDRKRRIYFILSTQRTRGKRNSREIKSWVVRLLCRGRPHVTLIQMVMINRRRGHSQQCFLDGASAPVAAAVKAVAFAYVAVTAAGGDIIGILDEDFVTSTDNVFTVIASLTYACKPWCLSWCCLLLLMMALCLLLFPL